MIIVYFRFPWPPERWSHLEAAQCQCCCLILQPRLQGPQNWCGIRSTPQGCAEGRKGEVSACQVCDGGIQRVGNRTPLFVDQRQHPYGVPSPWSVHLQQVLQACGLGGHEVVLRASSQWPASGCKEGGSHGHRLQRLSPGWIRTQWVESPQQKVAGSKRVQSFAGQTLWSEAKLEEFGKNQNPWAELKVAFEHKTSIALFFSDLTKKNHIKSLIFNFKCL